MAQEKLKGTSNCPLLMPGNDDPPQVAELINDSQVAVYAEGRCVQLDETHEMISLGYSNPTPWHTERELPEDALKERLEAMTPLVKVPQNLVVNFHAPPYDSRLDTAPELKEDFQINTQMGQPVLVPVGSKAVRAYIEKHQPLLGLHGHVHESDGMSRIGRTLCINPGSAYRTGCCAEQSLD